jgi:hypothetical protein
MDPAARHGSLVERLRAVHLEMVDAVLGGDGLGRVAELAASAAGGPVAIVVPRLGAAVVSGGDADLAALRRYAGERGKERPAPVPPGVVGEVPISRVTSRSAACCCWRATARLGRTRRVPPPRRRSPRSPRSRSRRPRRRSSRTCAAPSWRSCGPRPDELDPHDVVRRAARLGCDLARGRVVLCAELSTDRPRHVVGDDRRRVPGALAQHMELPGARRACTPCCPAAGRTTRPEATLGGGAPARAAPAAPRHRRRLELLRRPGELGRAIQEAELVLDVLRRSDVPIAEDIGTGTYRLLFRVLASHPEEVRSFYEDTVAPIVKYDDQYATDLVGTLEAYLEQNCNMNATAAAIYAHRHTVAYRLDRVERAHEPGPDAIRGPASASGSA